MQDEVYAKMLTKKIFLLQMSTTMNSMKVFLTLKRMLFPLSWLC